ncbi:MAG TPA: AAA family ATPase [Verrucomicrobiales bacterium]|nr:AAA family ATPase [Verrucomicrobiales bacterium]
MNKAVEYASEQEIEQGRTRVQALRDGLNGVLFGQEDLIDTVVAGLFARGHLLLEGLPGLGKTELVKALAKALRLDTRRIQFTPDLLPGDITGNPILQEGEKRREFVFQPGPLFTNLCLADEINRASPKTQSALLEAMQERRVTVLGETHPLPEPFFVLATQNPIELEGTYPLPEAQLDRFLFKVEVRRNTVETLERIVTHRELGVEPEVPEVMDPEELARLLTLVRRIYLPETVANYIARLVNATHPGESAAAEGIRFGASPRAALSLASASKARALMEGRPHASFEDVKAIAVPVLQHRLVLEYSARIEGRTSRDIVVDVLKEVPFHSHQTPKPLKEEQSAGV